MALALVSDYIAQARGLLQDESVPYRYSDASIVENINSGINEAYRMRPDMWINYFGKALPVYTAATPGATVDVPKGYALPFLYYIVGLCQLRDQEDTSDARASQLLNSFFGALTKMPA